jgi:hypothetical protein
VKVGERAEDEADEDVLRESEAVMLNMYGHSSWRLTNTPFAHAIKPCNDEFEALVGKYTRGGGHTL